MIEVLLRAGRVERDASVLIRRLAGEPAVHGSVRCCRLSEVYQELVRRMLVCVCRGGV
jgi:hypothetical protein